MKEISISVVFVDSNINLKSETILPFHIGININWTTPDTFVVDNVSIEHPWSDFEDYKKEREENEKRINSPEYKAKEEEYMRKATEKFISDNF